MEVMKDLLTGSGIAATILYISMTAFPAVLIGSMKVSGIISGAMTDLPALEFANSLTPVHVQPTTSATVCPFTMFLRILLAQALILTAMQRS
jgi:putative transport protein